MITTMTPNKSTNPFFGIAYELSITTRNGQTIIVSSDAWEPEALRFTFSIEQWATKFAWFADIEIFNCDGVISSGPSKGKNLAQTVISEGDIVTLKAGYQAGNTPRSGKGRSTSRRGSAWTSSITS